MIGSKAVKFQTCACHLRTINCKMVKFFSEKWTEWRVWNLLLNLCAMWKSPSCKMERNEENLISTGARYCGTLYTSCHTWALFIHFLREGRLTWTLDNFRNLFDAFFYCRQILWLLPFTNNEKELFVPLTITENKMFVSIKQLYLPCVFGRKMQFSWNF